MHQEKSPSQELPKLDVIVIGEALIDIVASPSGTLEIPGGSPANVAYGLGRLGIAAGLLTSLGDDNRGDRIAAHLREANVLLLPGSQTKFPTATATASLSQDGSASYAFNITWQLAATNSPPTPKLLHTGSIATFLGPGAATVKTILEETSLETMITYDPNIRPAILGSQSEAKSIFEDLIPLTNVVKLSAEDARWLYPLRTPEEVAAHILKMGAQLVVVTLGSQGSILSTSDTRLFVPSETSLVVDTIGAGDSYMSALIMGLLARGTDGFAPSVMEQLGYTASVAAAITVQRPGAQPPTSEEITRYLTSSAAKHTTRSPSPAPSRA